MRQFSRTLRLYDDTLTVDWTGSAWVSPCNGRQHSNARDAMRAEVRAWLLASGDNPDHPVMRARIETWLSSIV